MISRNKQWNGVELQAILASDQCQMNEQTANETGTSHTVVQSVTADMCLQKRYRGDALCQYEKYVPCILMEDPHSAVIFGDQSNSSTVLCISCSCTFWLSFTDSRLGSKVTLLCL